MTNKLEEAIELAANIESKISLYRKKVSDLVYKFHQETGCDIREIIISRTKNKKSGLNEFEIIFNTTNGSD